MTSTEWIDLLRPSFPARYIYIGRAGKLSHNKSINSVEVIQIPWQYLYIYA